jgi:ribosomal protein L7/L12
MIPEQHQNTVISSGLNFLRAITEAYGADEGMALWETIANTLDPDVKGQIFFAMIAGTHNDTVVLSNVKPGHDRVLGIKEIRHWTGMGLKEAKDVSDWVMYGKSVSLKVKPAEHHVAVVGLRRAGFVI